jgi:DNA-binding transcriptional regulator YiaG
VTPIPVTRVWLLALLSEHGATQCGAARMLRINPRTMRRWCAGDSTMPWAAAELLRLILKINARNLDTTGVHP